MACDERLVDSVYECYTMSWAKEFDPDQLDQDDPFEIDHGNDHHLAKHAPFTAEDLYDAFMDHPVFVDAPHEPAHLLMIAEIPGDMVVVPVMPAREPTQVRPIGIWRAGRKHREVFWNEYR